MNETIEKFGSWAGSQIKNHPDRVKQLLSTAYALVGTQAAYFPDKKYTSSREYLQGYTARLMSKILRHPEKSAVVNIFMSCEIFHVLGVKVSAPEALACYVTNTAMDQPFIQAAQDHGAPETLCSYHRTLLGMAESKVLGRPLLIANTTLACDANQLTFRQLAKTWDVPHFVVDVPYEPSEDAVHEVEAQLRRLGELVQELTHKRLEEEKLKEAVARSIRTQEKYLAYLKKRSRVHFPEVMTPEMLNVINNHLYLGSRQAEEYVDRLNRDLSKAPELHSDSTKLLWMHVMPNAQEAVKEIFQGADNHQVEVLACDLAYDNLVSMDPERPYESMARRMVFSSYNGPGSRRIDRTLQLARQLEADGILIFCQWGCKQTQGLSYTAKKRFQEEGIPALILDGDASDRTNEASGQAMTRARAFLEEIRNLRLPPQL
ncbi:MAG: 2-hydroxyacyl-CoA dehydratase [Blautia sp.]|nr:2-hydroxyacyl-CoA dehydratase [Blautia sp.]